MSQFPKEKLELANQEFSRTRDSLARIYQSGMEYIQNGLRGTSDKQYNLNLSLLSLTIVMMGVVIPIVLQSSLNLNHKLLGFSMCCFILSFLLGLIVSIYAPYKDRLDLNKIWKAQRVCLGNIGDMVKQILIKINDESITIEDINKYNEDSVSENKKFAEETKLNRNKLLNLLYYSFLTVFIVGLIIFIFAFRIYLF
jgi:hypothetical protein